jgi:3-oxoacyl-[acyl-carrier protein] reductase
MELSGKHALVTGASRGIGKGIALALARKGVHVAVNYCRNKECAQAVVEEIQQMGGSAIAVQADVSRKHDVEKMVNDVLNRFQAIDVLVNNAAIDLPGKKILEIDEMDWDHVIDVNLKSVYNCCQAVLKSMISGRQGKIVNISSIAGLRGTGSLPYVASKSGMIGITMGLARELAEVGITVNAVAPGLVETDMLRATTILDNPIQQEVPLGWLGQPEHIAHCVLFLLENDYMTGQVINISGGRLIAI